MRIALLLLSFAACAVCSVSAASLLPDEFAVGGHVTLDDIDLVGDLRPEVDAGVVVRQKRNPAIVRALLSVAQTLRSWFARRGTGTVTSTGLRVVTRSGGLRQAIRDFNRYAKKSDIATVRRFRNGRVAIGKDGSRMIVRSRSRDGRPTLEFQNSRGKSVLKIRYL